MRRKRLIQPTKTHKFKVLQEKVGLISVAHQVAETLLDWLRKNPLPQGILFENQQISIGALTALRKYGVNIPQEVKVVGFGMIPDYIYQDLKLVQMRISEIEGVLLTMDLLDKKIRQYSMSKVKIYTEAEMIIS